MYGSGGAACYILGYGTIAYILSYWLLAAVWRYATPRKLLSQADVFVSKYDSRTLGVLVSVVASGIHGSAWTAAIKDVLTLTVVVLIGLYLPIHYFGSIGEMFHRVQEAKPGFAALSDEQLTPVWFSSTVLLTEPRGEPGRLRSDGHHADEAARAGDRAGRRGVRLRRRPDDRDAAAARLRARHPAPAGARRIAHAGERA